MLTGLFLYLTPSLYDSVMADTSQFGGRMVSSGNTIEPATGNTKSIFSLAPNPTYGTIDITTSVSGLFKLQSIDGKEIENYQLTEGINTIQFPSNLAPGMYMGLFKPSDNSKQQVTKLVYQP